MNNNRIPYITRRIFVDVLLALSLFAMPWWVSVLFVIFFMMSEKFYIEGCIAGIVLDALFPSSFAIFPYLEAPFFSFFLVFLVFSFYAKKRLVFYNRVA